MLKKTEISEKLKKLKIEGTRVEQKKVSEPQKFEPVKQKKVSEQPEADRKPSPDVSIPKKPELIEPEKPEKIQEPKPTKAVEPKMQEVEKEPVRVVPKPQVKVQKPEPIKSTAPSKAPATKKEPILKVKKPEEIEEKKPEELIEPLITEKRDLIFISDLAIPAQKLSKLFRIETSYSEDTLTQILTAWKDPEKVIKWTVKHDKHGEEFYSLKGEGLMKMKDNPPIYGMEFDDGAIIATHMGEYTFTMGCYHFDVKTLVKIFAFGVENAKRFNL